MIALSRDDADVYVPDGTPWPAALERTTHLCIGAHPDDQEFMAYDGIATCFDSPDLWFTGVVVTNGGGSARCGIYADRTDEEMIAIRRLEQRKAATIGEYACQIQLAHPSTAVKAGEQVVIDDLQRILAGARPEVVYLHNPADKHDTHVATLARCIAALRALRPEGRPKRVIGCEIWRSLDWLRDEDKVIMDTDRHPNLAAALCGVFDSQIAGGKSYDQANLGRQAANATFFESHAVDQSRALSWGMDLTPLMHDDTRSLFDHANAYIQQFQAEVAERCKRFCH